MWQQRVSFLTIRVVLNHMSLNKIFPFHSLIHAFTRIYLIFQLNIYYGITITVSGLFFKLGFNTKYQHNCIFNFAS